MTATASRSAIAAAVLLGAMLATGGAQAQDERRLRAEAADLCRDAVRSRGYEEHRFDDVDVDRERRGWRVTGQAERRGDRTGFSCFVDDGRVRSVDVARGGGGGGGGGGYRPGPSGDIVTCESPSRRRNACGMNTRGGVTLVEQISQTRCVQGRNWGYDRSGVWVDAGCSGRFAAAGGSSGGQRPVGGSVPPHLVQRCVDWVMGQFQLNPIDVSVVGQRARRDGSYDVDVQTPRAVQNCTVDGNGEIGGRRR